MFKQFSFLFFFIAQHRNIISTDAGRNPRELENSVIETDRKKSVGVYDKVRTERMGALRKKKWQF